MIMFTQLKQRKGTFQKGHLYENVNVDVNQCIMVAVVVSRMGRTSVVFVDPGAKNKQ